MYFFVSPFTLWNITDPLIVMSHRLYYYHYLFSIGTTYNIIVCVCVIMTKVMSEYVCTRCAPGSFYAKVIHRLFGHIVDPVSCEWPQAVISISAFRSLVLCTDLTECVCVCVCVFIFFIRTCSFYAASAKFLRRRFF